MFFNYNNIVMDMCIVKINNLSFCYGDKKIFSNINLNIERNKVTTIIGSNGSGKSTLINILLGILSSYEGIIYIDGILLKKDNIFEIRKKIGYISDDVEDLLLGVNVLDNLVYNLENLGCKDDVIKKKLDYIVNLFKLEDILDSECFSLSESKKQLVNIASSLMHEPSLLIIDEGLSFLNKEDKKLVFDSLKKYRKKYNLSVLVVTHDTNITVLSDRIILLNNGKVLLNDIPSKVYSNTKLLTKLGIDIPFIIKLSKALMKENIIDKIYLDKKKLVDNIWK